MLKTLLLTLGILFPETIFDINFTNIQKLSFSTPQGLSYDTYTDNRVASSPKKVVMLLHGLVESGKNDIRLIGVAKTFVRAGYSVFVPDMEGLKNSQISSNETDEVKKYLLEMNRIYNTANTKGIISFCYANAPLIAALSTDERLVKEISFLIFWDGSYDLKEMFRYTLLGYYRMSDNEINFITKPDPELKQAISNQGFFFTKPTTKNESKLVEQFLSNQKAELFDACYDKLPKSITNCIEVMSPKNHIEKITNQACKMFFIHTVDDPVIPYHETVKLYNLCKLKSKKLLLLSIYKHVDKKKINLRDIREILGDVKNLYLLVREL